MRDKKGLTLLVAALVVVLLAWVGWLELASILGFSALPSGKPDRVQIRIGVDGSPLLTFRDAHDVQQLYAAIAALPHAQSGQLCPEVLGVYDTLIFQQGTTMLATVVAAGGGCPSIEIAGETRWQITPAFWRQLNQTIEEAIAQMTPPTRVQWLAIRRPNTPRLSPQIASSFSTQTAQRFYQALLALPVGSNEEQFGGSPSPDGYQLAFHTAHQTLLFSFDQQVSTASFEEDLPSSPVLPQLDDFTITSAFKHLFAEILSGVTFAPAHPDAAFFNATSSEELTAIAKSTLYQSLYQKILSLKPWQFQSSAHLQDCVPPGQRSVYQIRFVQEGLSLLAVQTVICLNFRPLA